MYLHIHIDENRANSIDFTAKYVIVSLYYTTCCGSKVCSMEPRKSSFAS